MLPGKEPVKFIIEKFLKMFNPRKLLHLLNLIH